MESVKAQFTLQRIWYRIALMVIAATSYVVGMSGGLPDGTLVEQLRSFDLVEIAGLVGVMVTASIDPSAKKQASNP